MDIRVVKEVNPKVDIVPVPRSPDYIRGLVNIRGQVALVMDLAVLFGHAPLTIGERSKIVILKTAQEIERLRNTAGDIDSVGYSDKPTGILVDRIADVIPVHNADLAAVPPHTSQSMARFVNGVVQLEKKLLIVLDAPEILSNPEGKGKGDEAEGIEAE